MEFTVEREQRRGWRILKWLLQIKSWFVPRRDSVDEIALPLPPMTDEERRELAPHLRAAQRCAILRPIPERKELHRLMRKLSFTPQQYLILYLHAGGCTSPEIAEKLGTSAQATFEELISLYSQIVMAGHHPASVAPRSRDQSTSSSSKPANARLARTGSDPCT